MKNKVVPLKDMIKSLCELDDYDWGVYAIKADILYRKIKETDYEQLIQEANECGEEYANLVTNEVESNDPVKIAEYYKIKVTDVEGKPASKKIIFASFTTPNKVLINKEPIVKVNRYIKKLNEGLNDFNHKNIYNILLAHEIFHFVENKYKKEIYSQNKQIVLWKLLGYKYKSNLRVLSEIAAMSFAKTLSGVKFSPFLLNIIMYYPYDSQGATILFNELMKSSKERKKEIVDA